MILSLSFTFINTSSLYTSDSTVAQTTTNNQKSSYKIKAAYGFRINILHAYYYDLDNDGYMDDIYTVISVYTSSGYSEQVNAYVYQYLTLPSGKMFYTRLYVHGYDSYFRIYTTWYNVATETGWYLFEAAIENLNYYGYSYDTESVLFDPPTEGPEGGMPTASFTIK